MLKIYVVIVKDETQQSLKIMDVKGYSHMSQVFTRYTSLEGNYPCRYCFIMGSNKTLIQNEVKEKLGNSFQSNLNFVELYDKTWHTLDR